MTKETMHVHSALAELKMLEERINKIIRNTTWVVANKHSNTKIDGKDVKAWIEEKKSEWQKLNDLIKRREAIKKAVVKSNAETTVVIAGETYTVAEAIERKNKGIVFLKNILGTLNHDIQMAGVNANAGNGDKLEARADEHVKIMLGNSDTKNLSEEAKKIRKDFIEAQTVEIIDPIEAYKIVGLLEEEISQFMMEVDGKLSVSNAITEIEIEY